MYLSMKGMMAHYERLAIADRSTTAIKQLIDSGMWREKPHWGWMMDPTTKEHVPDPLKAPIIDYIRDRVVVERGISIAELVRQLEASFNPEEFGLKSWHYNCVRAVIAYDPNKIPHKNQAKWSAHEQEVRAKRQAASRAEREEKERAAKELDQKILQEKLRFM